MSGGAAELFIWVSGLLGCVSVVCWLVFQFVTRDSISYDEKYVWLRKLNEDKHTPK